jgi:hypothetical protein
MYDAEDVFELLNSHDHKNKLYKLVQIWNQSTLEEEDEPNSWPKERLMIVSELTGFIKAGIKVYKNVTLNEQQATTGQGCLLAIRRF